MIPRTELHSSSLASLTLSQRTELIESLSDNEANALLYDWPFWARPSQQIPPGVWRIWLILAGRGYGKTRTGVEWFRHCVEKRGYRRGALVGRTVADVRDVLVEGESGLLSICPPWNMPKYEPSKRRLTWPNGAIATTYSADNPNELRGPQHDFALADELAAWRYEEAFDQLLFGLRLGDNPQVVVPTTPRPTVIIKRLRDESQIDDPYTDQRVYLTRGNTYENRANLAPSFIADLQSRYEGTRLGRQEIFADILGDNPRALWNRALIDAGRVAEFTELQRIVVAIDPATTSNVKSDETGICVAGLGYNGQYYVLDDLSGKHTPDGWARIAIDAYEGHRADRIVGESNNGGDLIKTVIHGIQPNASYKSVYASRGKVARAEPIVAMYEQGKVHHIGIFPKLEDQMCEWVAGESKGSPDRVDALVWALTELSTPTRGKIKVKQSRPYA